MTEETKETCPVEQEQQENPPDPVTEGQNASSSSAQEGKEESAKKKHKEKKSEKAEAQALAAALEEAKRLEQKLKEAQDAHLRTLAEYENYRKRTAKEKDNIYPDAVCTTASAFLPVMDAFERAMASSCADPDFFKGMSMILTQFQDVLQHLEIQPVGEEGEPFDPEKHNAVMHVEDDSMGENLVVQVFQKGYVRGDRVLRHAMVKVAN